MHGILGYMGLPWWHGPCDLGFGEDGVMLYEVRGTVQAGGEAREVVRMEIGRSDEDAIRRFLEGWTQYGDEAPTGVHVTQRWSVQSK